MPMDEERKLILSALSRYNLPRHIDRQELIDTIRGNLYMYPNGGGKLSTRVYNQVKWTITDLYRKSKRHRSKKLQDYPYITEDVSEHLDCLTVKERKVVEGLYLSGFSLKELSKRMGISRPTIKNILNKALGKMKNECLQ